MIAIVSGILICIGAIIDEAQADKYIRKKPCARARELLVLKWLTFGYILTISYKSVLLSTLIHINYENPIDSIEDALQSQKQIVSSSDFVLSRDKRTKVKELAKMIKRFDSIHGMAPLWVMEG